MVFLKKSLTFVFMFLALELEGSERLVADPFCLQKAYLWGSWYNLPSSGCENEHHFWKSMGSQGDKFCQQTLAFTQYLLSKDVQPKEPRSYRFRTRPESTDKAWESEFLYVLSFLPTKILG